jgi:hypothetical protein
VTGLLKITLKHTARTVAGLLPAALLVEMGMPALGALVLLSVLTLGLICWIISNRDRSDRVTRMILAWHGNASCLAPAPRDSSLIDSPRDGKGHANLPRWSRSRGD